MKNVFFTVKMYIFLIRGGGGGSPSGGSPYGGVLHPGRGVLHPGGCSPSRGGSPSGGLSITGVGGALHHRGGGGSPSRGVLHPGGLSIWGGVPCDISHHAFNVTCMLPPHQLCTCLYTAWSCDLQCILGYPPPPPVDRQTPVKT